MDKEDIDKLLHIFLPKNYERQLQMQGTNKRLVHYCNADAAINIIRSKRFWFRNAKCMNDYLETQHGLDCVIDAWGNKSEHTPIKEALNNLYDGLSDDVEDFVNGWLPHIRFDTYIACFSEHENYEDSLGRLSMWRAYGNNTGVALVMNNEPFFNEDDEFEGIYTAPVSYEDGRDVKEQLEQTAKRIMENTDFLKHLSKEELRNLMFHLIKSLMICTKHKGFSEEKEWRVIYCPKFIEHPAFEKEILNVNNIPQTIYKFPLEENKGKGVNLEDLINQIIIGPTEYPLIIYNAFVELLQEAGVSDPENKVQISYIPLRN